jgi:hypothetical protein
MSLKKLCFTVCALLISSCTTPTRHTIDMEKLKENERVYSGKFFVELNGKTNPELTCDLFVNSDFAPTVRLAADGEFLFKTTKKSLAFSRIGCLIQHENKERWIYQKLGIPRINQPSEEKAKEIYNMGEIRVTWTVRDSDLAHDPLKGSQDPMGYIGKITVNVQSENPPAESK